MTSRRSVARRSCASRRVAFLSLVTSAAALACSAPPGVGDIDGDSLPPFTGAPGSAGTNGAPTGSGGTGVGQSPTAATPGTGGTGSSTPVGSAGTSALPVGGAGGSANAGGVGGTGSGTGGSGVGAGGTSTGAGGTTSGVGGTGAGGTGSVTLPDPPGDAFFFDDFEAGAPGEQPAAWDRWINYTTEAGNTLTGQQFALLDNQDCASGNQCVHFHAEGATQPAMLTFPLPANTNRLYVRAMVKTSKQVGNVAVDSVSNHETLIALRGTPNSGEFEIRFGGAKGALGFNIVGPERNDAVAPVQALWGSAPGISANQWHCVEVAFINDNAASPQALASLDGTTVRSVAAVSDWHVGLTQSWLSNMFVEVALGWQSFSPSPGNDVWMDDVVLSQSPIGCN
jgi:polysaccharide lyase-like protein